MSEEQAKRDGNPSDIPQCNVKGAVVDSRGNGLSNKEVSLTDQLGQTMSAITDGAGSYTLYGVDCPASANGQNVCTLTPPNDNYSPATGTVTIVSADRDTTVTGPTFTKDS